MTFSSRVVLISAMLTVSLPALAQILGCGDPLRRDGGYGPFDYTDPVHYREKLPIVDQNHFTPNVENLRGGATEAGYNNPKAVAGDLRYTLMAFPNHHRALASMIRLSFKENKPKPDGQRFTVECWLDRAIRWRPEDGTVRMLYGNYLSHAKIKRYDEAIAQYKKAEDALTNQKTMGNLYYNMGLLYFNKKDYEKARDFANKAYARGFPLSGLKEMLVRAGKWQG